MIEMERTVNRELEKDMQAYTDPSCLNKESALLLVSEAHNELLARKVKILQSK